jgi:diacylglycerol kinase
VVPLAKFNRIQSFQYAFAGLWYTLKTQRNAQIHLIAALIVFGLGVWLNLTFSEWAIISLTVGFVITTEMLNTVAESAMDYTTLDFDPQVKIIKDVAAGAVLVAAVTSVLVGLLILGPPLYYKLVAAFGG